MILTPTHLFYLDCHFLLETGYPFTDLVYIKKQADNEVWLDITDKTGNPIKTNFRDDSSSEPGAASIIDTYRPHIRMEELRMLWEGVEELPNRLNIQDNPGFKAAVPNQQINMLVAIQQLAQQ